jgi:hypothetical protein
VRSQETNTGLILTNLKMAKKTMELAYYKSDKKPLERLAFESIST